MSHLYSKNELSYEVSFFPYGIESIEVTNFCNHFRWMWSDVPKVIQNKKLDFLHIGRHRQKQPIAGRISKILVGESDGWRFAHFLTDGETTNPTWLKSKTLRPQNFQGQSDFEFIFCMIVQYHDRNLPEKFWLLMASGVLSKVSLKVKLMFFKIQNIILPSICRHE